ncbi:MAG: SMP-30/gluconolactonase/LRE family protein [Nocardioidaceae bacterium]
MSTPRVLVDGLVIGESTRWHDDRVWLSHWGSREVLAIDMDGNREVMAMPPVDVAYSIDWLPNGRLLVTSGPEGRLLRQESDGSLVDHADLTGIGFGGLNEIVVDGRGNVYVNGGNDFDPPEGVIPGGIALVTPDGVARQVADRLAFPNGMAVTPDNATLIVAESHACRLTAYDIAVDGSLSNRRVWADLEEDPPDGICIDAEGAVWYADVPHRRCVRVAEGGRILQTVDVDRGCFACALGGLQGSTLFIAAAQWRGPEHFFDQPYTGQVLAVEATAPGAGWP